MKYDVEADWLLLHTCNFRCGYCFSDDIRDSKIEIHGTHIQWRKGFDDTGKTWMLHITGGEPTLYPGFVDLCRELSQNHYLSINSNLSNQCITNFAHSIDPTRVNFINAAIHFEERQKIHSLDKFIEHVHVLKNAGFNVLVSLVMTPSVIDDFPNIAEYFGAKGLNIIPKIMRGCYDNNQYPTGYCENHKLLLYQYMCTAQEQYSAMLSNMEEPPTINMFLDRTFLDGIKDYRGLGCSAGYKFVTINPDGTVRLCSTPLVLGNILSNTVRLMRTPSICKTIYCPYFCEKYSFKCNLFSKLKMKFG